MHISLLTANVMAPVAPPVRFNGQHERMQQTPQAMSTLFDEYSVDCIAVQESIIPSQHKTLACGFRHQGYMFCTKPLLGKLHKLKLVDGGVCIFSKHPIVDERQRVFLECECDGSDCLAAKGVVYAKIDKLGAVFHVVATHFQAWGSPKGTSIRECQAKSVGKFITDLALPSNEPVFVLGDFNVDMYSQPRHLQKVLASMGVRRPPVHPNSVKFTSDPKTNQLMGNDEDTAYASKQWPDGCYKEYMKTLQCPCCPTEWLDYITVWKRGLQPNWRHAFLRALPLKSSKPFSVKLALSISRRISSLSDHYPVVAVFEFPQLHATRVVLAKPPVAPLYGWSWKWILALSLCVVAAFIVIVVLVMLRRK